MFGVFWTLSYKANCDLNRQICLNISVNYDLILLYIYICQNFFYSIGSREKKSESVKKQTWNFLTFLFFSCQQKILTKKSILIYKNFFQFHSCWSWTWGSELNRENVLRRNWLLRKVLGHIFYKQDPSITFLLFSSSLVIQGKVFGFIWLVGFNVVFSSK